MVCLCVATNSSHTVLSKYLLNKEYGVDLINITSNNISSGICVKLFISKYLSSFKSGKNLIFYNLFHKL